MAAERSPALPWGRPNSGDPGVIADVPAQMSLPLGSARIEVLWVLTSTDDEDAGMETSEHKWWPATLLRRADGQDGQGRSIYTILYDADVASGYPEPTEHCVSFLDEHELFDVGECDLLDWRIEGTGWERPRRTAALVEEPGHGLVESTTLAEVAEQGRKIELASGRSLRSEMADLVSALPPEAQHGMAERLNAGLAAFSEEIARMVKETDGPVIQLQHVEEMVERLHARLGRGGADRGGSVPPAP